MKFLALALLFLHACSHSPRDIASAKKILCPDNENAYHYSHNCSCSKRTVKGCSRKEAMGKAKVTCPKEDPSSFVCTEEQEVLF
jgi:hypothetical protein